MANYYSGWVTPPNGGAAYRIRLAVNVVSQSIEDNTSLLSWHLRIEKNRSHSGFYNYPGASWGVNLDGGSEELSGSGTKPDEPWTGTSTWTLGSGTKTIAHDADGSKSLTGIRADFTRSASGWAPSTLSFSGKDLTLPTIPRATQPTVSPVSGNTAETYTITHNPAASSFYHDVAYSLDGGGTWTNIATNLIGTDISTDWTPAHSLLPDSTSVTAVIRVITKDGSGGATIGTKTVNLPLSVPSSVKPTISAVAWADDQTVSPDLPTFMGGSERFVQRWSRLKPTISSAGAGGSTVEGSYVGMNGQETVSGVAFTNPVQLSGAVPFSATVTDSRDRDSSAFADTVTVKAYSFPSLPTPLVSRTSDAGGTTPDPAGTYLAITPAASVSSLNFGDGEKNLLEWRVRTRPAGGSWTTVQDWTASTVSGNVWTTKYVAGGSYAADTEYEVEVSIRDLFGKNGYSTSQTVVTKTVPVATESVFMDRNANQGIGFGRYHADGGKFVQVAGGLEVTGGVEADSVLVSGNPAIAMDVTTIEDGNVPVWNEISGEWEPGSGSAPFPLGVVLPWFTDTLPGGALWAEGGTASRTEQAALFALIGTKFGAGDGSTTFGLPDMRAVGMSQGGVEADIGSGLDHHTFTVTFDEPFPAGVTPGVAASYLGYTAGTGAGDPSATLEYAQSAQTPVQVTQVTNTGFTATIRRTSSAYSTGNRYYLGWSASAPTPHARWIIGTGVPSGTGWSEVITDTLSDRLTHIETYKPFASAERVSAMTVPRSADSPVWENVITEGGITYSTTTREFTMPRDGRIRVDAQLTVNLSSQVSNNTYVGVYLNGTSVAMGMARVTDSGGGASQTMSTSRTIPVSAGDAIKILFRSQSSAPIRPGPEMSFVTMEYTTY